GCGREYVRVGGLEVAPDFQLSRRHDAPLGKTKSNRSRAGVGGRAAPEHGGAALAGRDLLVPLLTTRATHRARNPILPSVTRPPPRDADLRRAEGQRDGTPLHPANVLARSREL